MHGVSEVIAIILILMITISLAGLAYMFMSTTMSDVTASAGSTVDTTTSSMLTSFRIESADSNYIYVRNTGQNALTGLSVYVNDEKTNSVPGPIATGNVTRISLGQVAMKGDTVKVTSSDGFSVEKTLTMDCYGAVGYWKLDENGGTVAYDSSPNGNSGNLTNGPVWVTGRFGSGLLFDGTNDYVISGNNNVPFGNSSRSVFAWIKLGSVSNYEGITSWGAWGSGGNVTSSVDFGIDSSTHKLTIADKGFPASILLSPSALDLDAWINVGYTYQGDTNLTTLYINGVNVSSKVFATGLNTLISNVYIGRYFNGYYFNGTIDDVAIWNRTLTTQEAAKLYGKVA